MLVFLIVGIAVLTTIIASYLYRQVHYKSWLKTEEGILQTNLDKLRKDPVNTEALKIVSPLLYKKKQYEKAYTHYAKLVVYTDQEYANNKYLKQNNIDRTEEQFKIYLEFGISAYKIKKYEDAMIGLKKARRISPNSTHLGLSLTLGHLLFRKELYNEAARELRIANSKDSSNLDLMYYLGICRERLGEYDNALSMLRPIESKFRKNPIFTRALANCYAKTHDANSAAKLYKTLLGYPKMAAEAASELGLLYIKANDTTQALEYLEQVPNLEQPAGELTYQALYESAQIYAKIGKLREACIPLQKLFQINPLYLETKSLLRNYKEMLNNYNLYILYYGTKAQKQKLLRKFVKKVIPDAWKIEHEVIEDKIIEAVVDASNPQGGRSYFLWMNMATGIVTQERTQNIVLRAKQLGCNSFVLITIDSFDTSVIDFSKTRPVDLIEGSALREHLMNISNDKETKSDL